jgi:hypothetical protein
LRLLVGRSNISTRRPITGRLVCGRCAKTRAVLPRGESPFDFTQVRNDMSWGNHRRDNGVPSVSHQQQTIASQHRFVQKPEMPGETGSRWTSFTSSTAGSISGEILPHHQTDGTNASDCWATMASPGRVRTGRLGSHRVAGADPLTDCEGTSAKRSRPEESG